ncbi:hypothetical protein DPMN_031792, partial [Dreissena polymorpha]
YGEGEKLVKDMFAVAKELQPSVVFMGMSMRTLVAEPDLMMLTPSCVSVSKGGMKPADDSKLSSNSSLTGLVADSSENRFLIMVATNRPWELDDAVLRRFSKRVYVSIPNAETRLELLRQLLGKHNNPLSDRDLEKLAELTEGYFGSDLNSLAKDAALGPIRKVKEVSLGSVRLISLKDFQVSLQKIRRSVEAKTLNKYIEWNKTFGDMSM